MKIVCSGCLIRNPASGRILEKNGFRETGRVVYKSGKLQGEPSQRAISKCRASGNSPIVSVGLSYSRKTQDLCPKSVS